MGLSDIPLKLAFRYSNTLLVTFNNRIALRNMNKGHAYGSGKHGVRPVVFAAIDIESVRAAHNKSIEHISTAES